METKTKDMKEYTVKVYPNGTKEWLFNGERHREHGAAVVYADGTKEWWKNGQLHREHGAAIEYASGIKEWYLNGEKLTHQDFVSRTQIIELTIDEIAEKFGIPIDKLKIKR